MQYTKAIIAGLVALVGGIAVGYTDDSLTKGEFWAAVAAAVTALGTVFGVRNAEPDQGEEGELSLTDALLVAVLIGVVLLLFGVRLD